MLNLAAYGVRINRTTIRRTGRDTAQVPARSIEPFGRALREVLDQRGISVRELARDVGLDSGHLTRLIRHDSTGQKVTGEVAERIALQLDLDPGFFVETREAAIVRHMRARPAWRDETYDTLEASGQFDADQPKQSWAVAVQPEDGSDEVLRMYASWVGARAAYIRLKGARRLVRCERHGSAWTVVETIEDADAHPADS